MTTKLYVCIVGSVSAGCVLCAGVLVGLHMFSQQQPARPAWMPSDAIWRPTPTDQVALWPHGDWVYCRREGVAAHCVLSDCDGNVEYEGSFVPVPDDAALPDTHLQPIPSETISPWMWSAHAGRLVPVIELADGAVLTPEESRSDLRSYVERIRKFSTRLTSVPVYLEYHPAGSPAFQK